MTETPCFKIIKAQLLSIFDSLHAQYLRNSMQNKNIADLLLTQVKIRDTGGHCCHIIINNLCGKLFNTDMHCLLCTCENRIHVQLYYTS